ncbi:MAG: hypothetical protein H0T43_02840 [Solirubrobacterales bacterium]|nr:hypothetical protein [Solirubrobacterales bacterium]
MSDEDLRDLDQAPLEWLIFQVVWALRLVNTARDALVGGADVIGRMFRDAERLPGPLLDEVRRRDRLLAQARHHVLGQG